MNARIVGQAEAVAQIVNHYQTYLAGLATGGRPICNLLMLGPTGCGKTRIAEALAEALAGDRQALIKVDCGEFQHSHEIAKLIGSPPGYLGHRETHPRLCQERLDLYHSDQMNISFVLFDEIEKASDALWNLLLGILDKGTLTLGDNRQVDFSRTMVFMTGNLGTAEAQRLRDLPWGFAAPRQTSPESTMVNAKTVAAGVGADGTVASGGLLLSATKPSKVMGAGCTGENGRRPQVEGDCWSEAVQAEGKAAGDSALKHKMEKAVLEAAKRKFAPEFLNRLDRVILCHPLSRDEIADVLDLELTEIVTRVQRHRACSLLVSLTDEARNFLVDSGFNPDCGARYLKRTIEKHIVQPLSSLLATSQIGDGDELIVDVCEEHAGLSFRRGAPISTRLALQQLSAQWNSPPLSAGRRCL